MTWFAQRHRKCQKLIPRRLVPRHLRLDTGTSGLVARVEAGAYEVILTLEVAVERSLGYTRTLDDLVDADALRALLVEQFAGSGQQPVAPGRETSEAALEALRTLGILHLAESACTEISGGERQLVQIARVLVQAPKPMILDEPTAHLDFTNQARFLVLARRLANRELAIIFSTHAPDQAF